MSLELGEMRKWKSALLEAFNAIWRWHIKMGVDLARGYLFRSTTPDLGIKNAPFTFSEAESQLKGYSEERKADTGETLHGFHSSRAITLAVTGADLAEITDHVGWTRRHTAFYNMQLAKVPNST